MAKRKYKTVATSPQQGSNRPKDKVSKPKPVIQPIPGSMEGPHFGQKLGGSKKPKIQPKPKPKTPPILQPIPGQKGFPGPKTRWPGGIPVTPPALTLLKSWQKKVDKRGTRKRV